VREVAEERQQTALVAAQQGNAARSALDALTQLAVQVIAAVTAASAKARASPVDALNMSSGGSGKGQLALQSASDGMQMVIAGTDQDQR